MNVDLAQAEKPQLAHSFHPWRQILIQWLPLWPDLVEAGGFNVVMLSSGAVMSCIALYCSSDMVRLGLICHKEMLSKDFAFIKND